MSLSHINGIHRNMDEILSSLKFTVELYSIVQGLKVLFIFLINIACLLSYKLCVLIFLFSLSNFTIRHFYFIEIIWVIGETYVQQWVAITWWKWSQGSIIYYIQFYYKYFSNEWVMKIQPNLCPVKWSTVPYLYSMFIYL